MSKTIFLDTNVYLHYRRFDEIDWTEIVGAKSITVIVPPVVVRELNKHKDFHSQPRVRKCAGRILKRLAELLEAGPGTPLRDGVHVRFEDRDPVIDFSAYQLSREVQDDNLIASIIMCRNETPEAEVVLVTSDVGLALLAKAGRQGIETIRMPEKLRVAEQPDPAHKRIGQLEQELRELKSRVPQLSLTFEDGKQHAAFVLPAPVASEPDEPEHKLNEIKRRYPRREESERPSQSGQIALSEDLSRLIAAIQPMSVVPREEITRYNAGLDKFYQDYSKYLEASIPFENLKRRTVELAILLANDGTAPAEDIDVFMHFPDGFRLVEGRELPRPPQPPEPPVQPRTAMEMFMEPCLRPVEIPLRRSYYSGPIAPPPNVSAPSIKRVGSYHVSFRVQGVKHHLQESLGPLYVVFDSFEGASSFQIDYRILAANVPHEIVGKLHVVIEKAVGGP